MPTDICATALLTGGYVEHYISLTSNADSTLSRAPLSQRTRNRATLALEVLLDGESEALIRKAFEMALSGDTTALRLCLERILPLRKDRPVAFSLPTLERAEDAVKASAALCEAVSSGRLTPSEAGELSKLVDGFTRAVELPEIQQRLERLEAAAVK